MIPTHATKAGIRYRYYASTPVLNGEAKTASAGSVSRVPAADIEGTTVKSLEAHLAASQDGSAFSAAQLGNREALAQLVTGIVVHSDRLVVRFKSDHTDEPDRPDGPLLIIPWQKPPSKKCRRILLPHNASRNDARPEHFERRARLVSAIAKGRRWLDDVVSGRVTNVTELCTREKCSIRQVNMTISLAFLAPDLVKAAVDAQLVFAIAKGRRWLDDVVSGRVTNVQEICIREKCSVRQVNMTISLGRTSASITAFIEFCYQESLALVEQNKTVVLAIAQALIDHPKPTLDGAEIDAVIAPALAAKAAADEHKRRTDWNAVLDNAAAFTAVLES